MIDLHMHTKYSDGTDTCIELLKHLEEKGLDVVSITDHNTAQAYEELEKIDISKYYKGKIIPGIELNTKVLDIPIEILGYNIDYKIINKLVKEVYLPAERRNKLEAKCLFEKCIKRGLKIDKTCIERFDDSMFASKFIHNEIIKNEENKKFITEDAWKDVRIFYRKYMSSPKSELYVEIDNFVPDFETAANLVKKSGGLVFLPHIFEYRENSKKILDYILKNYNFDGIECYYTTFTEEQTQYLLNVCNKYKKFKSGGSDYHGKNKPNVDVGTGMGNLKIENDIIGDWETKKLT